MMLAEREKRWNDFIEQGLPSRKQESWKYTDLSILTRQKFVAATPADPASYRQIVQAHRLVTDAIMLVFVNGFYAPSLSDGDKLPKGAVVTTNHAQHAITNTDNHPFAALNQAIAAENFALQLADRLEINEPVQFLSITSDSDPSVCHPRRLVKLGIASRMKLLEECVSLSARPYLSNVVTNIEMGEGACLEYNKIQTEGKHAIHLSAIFIHQKKDSRVLFTNFSSGSMFARDDVVVALQEAGAECKTGGFYRLNESGQYIDNHIDINHAAPSSQSEMLYKGILDKQSKAVFNGRLHVEKNAQKILAYQANHNLLLSNYAEVYSKPELEIYADDVKCKHGATTGQIDDDALFYMQSRGIKRQDALNMLLQGFAEDVFERITCLDMRKRAESVFHVGESVDV